MSLTSSDHKQEEQKQARKDTAVSPSPPTPAYTYYSNATPPPPRGLQTYKPLPYQIERAQKNKRSTRWHYLPIAIVSTLAILFALFLLSQAIWPRTEYTRAILSGMADFTLIMFMLPLSLLFIFIQLGMLGFAIYIYQWKREMPDSPIKQYGYVRILLWQIEHYLERGRPYIERANDKLSSVVITFNKRITTIESWLKIIKKWIVRS